MLNTDITLVERLWDRIKISQEKFDEYLQLTWGKVDTMEMEDQIKKLRKAITDIKGLN